MRLPEVRGQKDWTQFIHCDVFRDGGEFMVRPLHLKRRLASMARAQVILTVREGEERVCAGETITCTCLDPGIL